MSSRKVQGVEDLVSFVVNTARDQGIPIAPQTETHIIFHCGESPSGEAQPETMLRNEHEVKVVAAALIAGGFKMAQESQHDSVTPGDVDMGYMAVLRGKLDPPDTDMTCIDIFSCRQTTILSREYVLKAELDSFRTLLGAIGEL